MTRIANIFISISEGIIKKRRDYESVDEKRLCPEKRRKNISGSKGLRYI